ncbi:hypothetical protein ACFLRC_04065 [Candidatus Altiarchaeota archaeon]
MSFSTVGAQAVFYTVVMAFLLLLVQTFNDYTTETSDSVLVQYNNLKGQLETETDITSISYDNATSPDNTTLSLKNTGSKNLKTTCIDVYLDRVWVSNSSLTKTLLNTTHDPTLWNPDEELEIVVERDLSAGDHEAIVVACNGVSDSRLFST